MKHKTGDFPQRDGGLFPCISLLFTCIRDGVVIEDEISTQQLVLLRSLEQCFALHMS